MVTTASACLHVQACADRINLPTAMPVLYAQIVCIEAWYYTCNDQHLLLCDRRHSNNGPYRMRERQLDYQSATLHAVKLLQPQLKVIQWLSRVSHAFPNSAVSIA